MEVTAVIQPVAAVTGGGGESSRIHHPTGGGDTHSEDSSAFATDGVSSRSVPPPCLPLYLNGRIHVCYAFHTRRNDQDEDEDENEANESETTGKKSRKKSSIPTTTKEPNSRTKPTSVAMMQLDVTSRHLTRPCSDGGAASSSSSSSLSTSSQKDAGPPLSVDTLAIPVAHIQNVFRSRTGPAVKLLVLVPSSSSFPSFYGASLLDLCRREKGDGEAEEKKQKECVEVTHFFAMVKAAEETPPPQGSTVGDGNDTKAADPQSHSAMPASLSSSRIPTTTFSSFWTTYTLLLTFSSVAHREHFLQEVFLKAQGETPTDPSSSASSSPSSSRVKHERAANDEDEEAEEEGSGGVSPSLLPVALSDYFTHFKPLASIGRDGGEEEGWGGVSHRGVVQVTTNALESILIDPTTWELRPITEAMESDILRQEPRLAVLYARFVQGAGSKKDTTTKKAKKMRRMEADEKPKSVGKAQDNEDDEENTEDEDEEEVEVMSSSVTCCTREAFWTAVARQYFCFAHTFLQESDEEEEEGPKNDPDRRSTTNVAHPPPPSPSSETTRVPPPNRAEDGGRMAPPSRSAAALPELPLAVCALNDASWRGLPPRKDDISPREETAVVNGECSHPGGGGRRTAKDAAAPLLPPRTSSSSAAFVERVAMAIHDEEKVEEEAHQRLLDLAEEEALMREAVSQLDAKERRTDVMPGQTPALPHGKEGKTEEKKAENASGSSSPCHEPREMLRESAVGAIVCPSKAIEFYSHPLSGMFTAARPLPSRRAG